MCPGYKSQKKKRKSEFEDLFNVIQVRATKFLCKQYRISAVSFGTERYHFDPNVRIHGGIAHEVFVEF